MSEKKDFFAIGHITNDLEPSPHIGGGVTYTAVGLNHLGYDAHIITKCPPGHPYITELENIGIRVHPLPVSLPMDAGTITSFKNYYDPNGHREQIVPTVQENISVGDTAFFPEIPKGSVILIAPVIAEVDPTLISILSEKGHVVVTPQGYFRERQSDGKVRRISWENVDALGSAEVAIFSDEDLTQGGVFQQATLEKIRQVCPLSAMTQGSEGATVFEGKKAEHLSTFPLTSEELATGDFTGAGDTFAAGFIASYFQNHNAREALAFGMLYAALKIAGIGRKGIGIQTIPTVEEVKEYTKMHKRRIEKYLLANHLPSLSITL